MKNNKIAPNWLPEREKSYVIFAFTGQGQQRPDMFEPWYGYSVETDAILGHFHEVTNTEYGKSLDRNDLEHGPLMQPANVTLGVIGSMALSSSGIKPNETFGHSLGEYGAVYSAGFVSAEDIITLSRHRGKSTDKNIRQLLADQMPTGMMAVSKKTGNVVAEISEVLTELRIPNTELSISNFNSEDQVVLSGLLKHMTTIKERTSKSLRKMILDVDGPYHQIKMAAAKAAFKPYVNDLPIRQPKGPMLYSATTVGRLKTREEVLLMLIEQLVSPVQYAQLINERLKYVNGRHISNLLRTNGADEIVFVEIGAYPRGKPNDKGVLIGITQKNVLSYHKGNIPIRPHRVSEPEDIFRARLTKTD